MKTLFLFPGQGTQYPGMGRDFFDAEASVRQLFEMASDAAALDLRSLVFDGSEEDLKKTLNTQLSVALMDRVSSLMLRSRGVQAAGAAGFSLGEWPALAEAGVLSEPDMFRLLRLRAELMDKAVEKLGRPCGMSAILFLKPEEVVKSLEESGLPDIYPANFNSPVQVVISGAEASLAQAEELLKAKGARKVVRLKVSGPFHSPLIAYARDGLREALADVPFADPAIPLYSNVTGKRVSSGSEARAMASEQVTSPVRWTEEEEAFAADAYDRAVEAGPGSVLQGLLKAALPGLACSLAGKADQLEAFLA